MVRIAVFGAGAIGCWVGGRLAAHADVTLIGRPRVLDELRAGVRTTDLDGVDVSAIAAIATDAAAAATADVVLVTVKSAQTADAGAALAPHVRADTAVVSLQNGVRNARTLQAALPGRRVLPGMVQYNVIRKAPAHYHRATEGQLMFGHDSAPPSGGARDPSAPLARACADAGLAYTVRTDMAAVLWSKLLLNLGNAVNALCGLPLVEELSQRAFRLVMAACQREALALLAAAREPIAKLIAVPPRWMPRVLALPDAVFRPLAKRMIGVDPTARSSMWADLEAGRATEVDFLQGEIVGLADRLGRAAPVNRAIADLVHAAERGGRRDFRGDELLALAVAGR
jgi:2-dehydropantoate 2-reductase|nr:2-dehydropantoate 2-reductase [Kofleriaceae bacterium]